MYEVRLARCKQYLEEALLDPKNNKLYIEDLNISILMFEKLANQKNFVVMNGFKLDE